MRALEAQWETRGPLPQGPRGGSKAITSWQIGGEKVEAVTDFIFLGSKITADGYCSHEILKTLAPWKKNHDKFNSILKSRDITLPKMSV